MRSGIVGVNEARIRAAVSSISVRPTTASSRAAAAFGSPGAVSIAAGPCSPRRATQSDGWPSGHRCGRCVRVRHRGSQTTRLS
ncbi:hypothetical protein I552_0948 [Mycobacterium xenopi 3993]|nr:hypothetical protein I552_0948 [Mycobacterium xenopi 3993]